MQKGNPHGTIEEEGAHYSRFYYVACRAFRVIYDCLGRLEIGDEEFVPEKGAFLLASNHCSHLDPPLVGGQLRRVVHFLARATLWCSPTMSRIYNHLECIPIDRDGGGADIGAFKTMFKLIKQGEVIGVFPEGTRSLTGELQPAKAGIGMLACKFGVPVVPARIFGTFETLGSHRKPEWQHDMAVNYGAPLYPKDFDPGPKHPDRYQVAADRIMAAIAALKFPEPPML